MATMSTVYSRKRGNMKKTAAILWSTCLICGNNRRTAMRNDFLTGEPREIKSSLREFEALLAQEEKVSA
jgi:hypothetical protein